MCKIFFIFDGMENIFGGLIEFEDKKTFENFVERIDQDGSIQIMEMAILYGQQNGLYSLEESHILYKCINKLKEKSEEEENIS
jgi:hypothetical protein